MSDATTGQDARQVIIVSTQAKMPKGKVAAQVAHASLGALLTLATTQGTQWTLDLSEHPDVHAWLSHSFTKVAVKCDDPDEMVAIYERAKAMGLPCAQIVDEGRTHFNGVATLTTVGIGPASPATLAGLTGHLKLL